MYDLETQAKFNYLRMKAAQNTLTLEETKEAVALLAKGRASAAVASTAARTTRKAAAIQIDGDDLLSEMLS